MCTSCAYAWQYRLAYMVSYVVAIRSGNYPIIARACVRYPTFENAETGQQYQDLNQLLYSLKTTPKELMNRAYAFIDDGARYLYQIQ